MRIHSLLIVLCLTPVSHAAENALGRLFFSQAQRAQLETLRQQPATLNALEPLVLSVDGEVRRSSGHDTHWINGDSRSGRLNTTNPIPVGDRIDSRSGERHRLLGDGQLHTKRPGL